MPEKPTPAPCPISSYSAAVFLARLSALQEPEKDSEIRAALSSLNWPDWLKPGSLRICCLKMYPACYLMTEGGHLRQWIGKDAIACEDSYIGGDAILADSAVARDSAYVGNNAVIADHAVVQDNAIVCGGYISGNSCICGSAILNSDEQTRCAPMIGGNARVYGELTGNVVCQGGAVVLPGVKLYNTTADCFVLKDDTVSVVPAQRPEVTTSKETKHHENER